MTTIIGNGTLGKALGKAMKIVPLPKSDEQITDDVVFICVPTPTIDYKQDLSEVEQAISRIKQAGIVVIRSTILPGTTDRLQQENIFPIMFLPEFGKEKTMEEDIANPEVYIFGMTEKSKPFGGMVLDVLPRSPKRVLVSAMSAEFAKYFSNVWRASQITTANTLYDWLLSQNGNDLVYQQALGAILNLSDIPKYGWKIFNEGKRGYSGKCLPKDFQAALGQYPNQLWQDIENYNNRLNPKTKLEEINENNKNRMEQ